MQPFQKNTCLATVLTGRYLPGFVVFVTSLLKHHPAFDLPILVFSGTGPDLALTETEKTLLLRYYPRIEFVEVHAPDYAPLLELAASRLQTPLRLRSAFFILEAFKPRSYARVITFDCDMLCLAPLPELFEAACDFGAVQAADEHGNPLPFFNTGVMVISGTGLSEDRYRRLLRAEFQGEVRREGRKIGAADQAILNAHFADPASYHHLPSRLNTTKRAYPDSLGADQVRAALARDGVGILHYVGNKPWDVKVSPQNTGYALVESLWERQFWSVADDALGHALTRQRRDDAERINRLLEHRTKTP